MTVSLLHLFTDPASDLPGFAGVKPSNWNAQHALTGLANSIAGFDGSGNALDGNLYWSAGILTGGTGAASTLTLESTSGAGTTDYVRVLTGSQVEALRVDSGQHVNIGNKGGPITDVFGGTPLLQVSVTGGGGLLNIRNYSADTSGAAMNFTKSRGATVGSNVTVVSGDQIGGMFYSAYDATGTPVQQCGAEINVRVDATPTAGGVPMRVYIATGSSVGTLTEAVRVDSSQNIICASGGSSALLFNTETPGLQNLGVGNSADFVCSRYSADAVGPDIYFGKSRNATLGLHTIVTAGDGIGNITWLADNGTDMHARAAQIRGLVEGTVSSTATPGVLIFGTAAAGAVVITDALRIDSGQNIVVGTAALATNATNGFLYVDSCVGTPSGTPTSYTGRIPIVVDTTNNLLWFYNAGWESVVDQTAWNSSFTPTVTAGSGTFTTVSATCRYKIIGKTAIVEQSITITTNGTAAGSVKPTLPVNAFSGISYYGSGRANALSGKQLQVWANGSQLNIVNYDGTYPGASGENLQVTCIYETA